MESKYNLERAVKNARVNSLEGLATLPAGSA